MGTKVKSVLISSVTLLLLLSAGFFHTVNAACQLVSCTPVYSSDANLSNRVSSLQQISLSSFNPTDLYVGYEVTSCNTVPTIRYCSDSWHGAPPTNYCNGNKVDADASAGGIKIIGGKTYYIARVPGSDYNDHFAAWPRAGISKLNAIRTNIFDPAQACANDASITANYLSETCTVTPAATKGTDGKYTVALTISRQTLIPEKGYKAIFAPLNSLEVNPTTQASVFVVGGAPGDDPIHIGFSGIQADAGRYHVCVVPNESNDVTACASQKCENFVQLDNTTPTNPPVFVTPPPGTTPGGNAVPFELCDQTADATDKGKCTACLSTGAIWTAFGCVGTTKEGIVTSLLRVGMGISGGFVLLSILYGSFLLTTSSGDPNRVKEGQEMITSAIMGLLFVIFSIIILKFIGVTILQIPGFGST